MSRIALLCFALVLAAPAAAREVSGTLTAPEAIELPPGAEIALELRDPTGAVVADARFATQGGQLPLGFALTAPDDVDLVLRAAILDAGRPLREVAAVPVPAGDADLSLGELSLAPHVPMGFAVRLRCGAEEVTLGFVGQMARLRSGAEVIDLLPVPAASGAKFEAEGDPGTWVWSRGTGAMISLGGQRLPDCLPSEAMPILPFSAVGHEPPWAVRLDAESLRLTLEFGATVRSWPAPEAGVLPLGGGVVYAAEGLEMEVRHAVCRDSAIGMPHPFGVTLSHDGETYAGCGGDPRSLLTANAWRITGIDGAPVPGDPEPLRLAFAAERLSLAAPCNRASGSYTLTGEALTLGPIAATRMMCAPEAMRLEEALFAALATVDRFDVTDAGALVLIAADRPVLRATALPGD